MRRTDRQVTDADVIRAILDKAQVLHLGLAGPSGGEAVPYVVPMSFGYEPGPFPEAPWGRLWLHAAKKGRKMDILAANPEVCCTVAVDAAVVGPIEEGEACDLSMRYRSVMAFGRAVVVEDVAEKLHGLGRLVGHYSDGEFTFKAEVVLATAVIRVDVRELTGKSFGYDEMGETGETA